MLRTFAKGGVAASQLDSAAERSAQMPANAPAPPTAAPISPRNNDVVVSTPPPVVAHTPSEAEMIALKQANADKEAERLERLITKVCCSEVCRIC